MTSVQEPSEPASIVKLADDFAPKQINRALDESIDVVSKILQRFKFLDNEDIAKRWPSDIAPGLEYDEEYDIFTYKNLIVLPQSEIFGILEEEWSDLPSSTGAQSFYAYLRRRYLGISLSQVKKFVRTEPTHLEWFQLKKSQKSRATIPKEPYHTLSIDFGFLLNEGESRGRKLTDKYVLVVYDNFTKHLWAALTSTKKSENHTDIIRRILESMPHMPKYIRSDQEFRSKAYNDLLKEKEIKSIQGISHNALGNARAEVAVKIVKTLLSSYQGMEKYSITRKPARDLERVLSIYNRSRNSTTGYAPIDLASEHVPATVIARVRSRLRELSRGTEPTSQFNYQLRPGDKVHIDVAALDVRVRRLKKQGQWKQSHAPTFSSEWYTVVSHGADNMVRVEELPNRAFLRGQVLYVVDVNEKGAKDRKAFVTEWQGSRDDSGNPVGKEDPFGYTGRKRPAPEGG